MQNIIDFLGGRFCRAKDDMIRRSRPDPKNPSYYPTFRRGVPEEWKEKFKPHHVELAEELLGDIIERLGYVV